MGPIDSIPKLSARVADYRELVRKGAMPPDPRMRPVGIAIASSFCVFVGALVLINVRLPSHWPSWVPGALFVIAGLSYLVLMYAAYIFSVITDAKAMRRRASEHHKRVT
jgi:hypothetical protein